MPIIIRRTLPGYFNRAWLFINSAKPFPAYLLLLFSVQLFAAKDLSEINNALFDSPHMQGIETSGRLNYRYENSDTNALIKDDEVSVDISNISDTGRTDQSYHFFSGENKLAYQDRRSVLGNGIFMMFLERDVHEMERQTSGSWRHFQRRIRWAMAAGASKKEVLLAYQGKNIKGTQYIIQPYANDEKSKRYGVQANKYYSFTLSDEIPGTIYEIRSIVPKGKSWKDGDEILIDERIIFTDFTPSQVN